MLSCNRKTPARSALGTVARIESILTHGNSIWIAYVRIHSDITHSPTEGSHYTPQKEYTLVRIYNKRLRIGSCARSTKFVEDYQRRIKSKKIANVTIVYKCCFSISISLKGL